MWWGGGVQVGGGPEQVHMPQSRCKLQEPGLADAWAGASCILPYGRAPPAPAVENVVIVPCVDLLRRRPPAGSRGGHRVVSQGGTRGAGPAVAVGFNAAARRWRANGTNAMPQRMSRCGVLHSCAVKNTTLVAHAQCVGLQPPPPQQQQPQLQQQQCQASPGGCWQRRCGWGRASSAWRSGGRSTTPTGLALRGRLRFVREATGRGHHPGDDMPVNKKQTLRIQNRSGIGNSAVPRQVGTAHKGPTGAFWGAHYTPNPKTSAAAHAKTRSHCEAAVATTTTMMSI